MKTTLTIKLSGDEYTIINDMVVNAGCSDIKQLLNEALLAYKWCVDRTKSGREVGSIDKNDGFIPLDFEPLNELKGK